METASFLLQTTTHGHCLEQNLHSFFIQTVFVLRRCCLWCWPTTVWPDSCLLASSPGPLLHALPSHMQLSAHRLELQRLQILLADTVACEPRCCSSLPLVRVYALHGSQVFVLPLLAAPSVTTHTQSPDYLVTVSMCTCFDHWCFNPFCCSPPEPPDAGVDGWRYGHMAGDSLSDASGFLRLAGHV